MEQYSWNEPDEHKQNVTHRDHERRPQQICEIRPPMMFGPPAFAQKIKQEFENFKSSQSTTTGYREPIMKKDHFENEYKSPDNKFHSKISGDRQFYQDENVTVFRSQTTSSNITGDSKIIENIFENALQFVNRCTIL